METNNENSGTGSRQVRQESKQPTENAPAQNETQTNQAAGTAAGAQDEGPMSYDGIQVREGETVEFTPSPNLRDRKLSFVRQDKKTFPAIIVDINRDTVDLKVFGGITDIHVTRVPHASEAPEDNRSKWNRYATA